MMPSRTPRVPSIGFCSCHDRAAVNSSRDISSSSPRASRGDELLDVGQELVQRGIEQADRDRQPVHRREDLLEVAALQLEQLGQRLGFLLGRVGEDHALHDRQPSPRNMCSVRHRPMPSAPYSRARAASGPLSALARTPSRAAADLVGPTEDDGELGRRLGRRRAPARRA